MACCVHKIFLGSAANCCNFTDHTVEYIQNRRCTPDCVEYGTEVEIDTWELRYYAYQQEENDAMEVAWV